MSAAQRIIANFRMERPGALVIAIGAIHGNEFAGVEAIKRVQDMLVNEPSSNPGFAFKGRFVGLIGNMEAYARGKRFIDQDMNRIWSKAPEIMQVERKKWGKEPYAPWLNHGCHEYGELHDLTRRLAAMIDQHAGNEVLILDLHTTSAESGIFTITLDNEHEQSLANTLEAPVVSGLLTGVSGTLLHFCQEHLKTERKQVSCLAFESGQHDDPLSVDRAVAAIIFALREMNCVRSYDVNYEHVRILTEYSKDLPKQVRIVHVHKIKPEDAFTMRPGYSNFQKITEGEQLATDKNGAIMSPLTGRILMPLYQKQGSDGFFIVEEVGSCKS